MDNLEQFLPIAYGLHLICVYYLTIQFIEKYNSGGYNE